MHEQDNRLKIR